MRFVVSHRSLYRYDVPVRLGAHQLRLVPRPGQGEVRSQQLSISPLPATQSTVVDGYGNEIVVADFGSTCQTLSITSELELRTRLAAEPPAGLARLPWSNTPAPPGHGPLTARVDAPVAAFAAELSKQAGGDVVRFLDRLTQALFQKTDYQLRHEGPARPAAETLHSGRGACRDLTVLFMDAVASQGLTSRFVSGYHAAPETRGGQHFLHAWPEVYLPAVGFIAWDPTHGVRVSDAHVALCAAATQAETMPIVGGYTFDGPQLNTTLDFTLTITTD